MSNSSQRATVIAGFPGIGKSYLTNSPSAHLMNYTILDIDTSTYSHLPTTGLPNPSFPSNYINAILPHLQTPNLILLVGVHDIVRDALVASGVDFTLVYPEEGCKEEYMRRWRGRGSPEGFLRKMEGAWGTFVGSCRAQGACRHVVLRKGEFLGERLWEILRR